ncbi:MAG: ferritin-like domain-containing protein [Actinobacteria bacterium]|nr:ferritin-like domain-containing protein [Actinomycetota bacterium]MBO0836200.1 ferritin-like domain-containing protein [Actinomycetota bacterium]
MTDSRPDDRERPAGPSRRAMLSAAALPLLLSACRGARGLQSLGTPPPPGRDIRVLRAAITAEKLMVARCTATIESLAGAGSATATAVAAVRTVQAEHTAHLAQLRTRLIEPAPPRSPEAAPTAGPAGDPAAALQALQAAEQAASDRLLGQLGGLPPGLAQLFASIAASEATHVPYLQQTGRSVPVP